MLLEISIERNCTAHVRGISMVGKTISHYKVLEKIGEGGMGEAFHGFNPLRTLRLSIAFTNLRTALKPQEEP